VQIRTGKTTSISFEPITPPMVPLENALSAELVANGVDGISTGPSKLRVGSYVVFGVGLAALITGIALGASSLADATSAKDKTLPISQARAFANSANGKGIGANVLFGVGGAAVAGGVLMFVFSMPEPGMKSAGGTK
jgi:hypothetical protein